MQHTSVTIDLKELTYAYNASSSNGVIIDTTEYCLRYAVFAGEIPVVISGGHQRRPIHMVGEPAGPSILIPDPTLQDILANTNREVQDTMQFTYPISASIIHDGLGTFRFDIIDIHSSGFVMVGDPTPPMKVIRALLAVGVQK